MVLGGFVFFPLAHKIGRSSAIFWSLVGLLLCNLWGGLMTGSGDYWRWLGSRFMSGFFGTVTGVLGPRILVDLFFLHQRGRAFTVFHYCFDFGTVAGPTLGAFIIAAGSWTNAYWWSVGLAGLSLVVCFIFLHETAWDRSTGIGAEAENKSVPEGFVANRIATFFPGTRLAPYSSWRDVVRIVLHLQAQVSVDQDADT
jgi:MFS family permease